MSEFKLLRDQEPPEVLYHYTDAESFLGIISKKEIWASNYLYCNDIAEFEYPKILLLDRIWQRKDEFGLSGDEANQLISLLKIQADQMTCVFSMSTQRDKLSQWRGYANSIPGFCIGVNSYYLRKISTIDVDDIFLCKCVYNSKDHIKLIDEIINDSFEKQKGMGLINLGSDLISRLIIYSPIIKMEEFEEEQEWRLIIAGVHNPSKNYEFRYRNNSILPYYKISNFDIEQMIMEVIISANPKQEINYIAVEDFCDRNGLLFIPQKGKGLYKSQLTYRNW